MNEMQLFNFNEKEIRTIVVNDKPYFVGKDVADVLGYRDTSDAIKRHVDTDDKLTRRFTDSGQSREMHVINESGLYSLIFGSKLDSAKTFKKWVTSVVLPEIRKTGGYNLPNYPDALRMLADSEEHKQRLLIENELLKPKAEFYDSVADSKTAIPMDQVAKALEIPGVGRNKLFEILRTEGILQSNNIPYQTQIDNGRFRVVESKYSKPNGDVCVNMKTLVYQKGVNYIRNILQKNYCTK